MEVEQKSAVRRRRRSVSRSRSRTVAVRRRSTVWRGLTSNQAVYHFVQSVNGSAIVAYGSDYIQQGGAVLNQAFYFQLNDLPQVTSFTGLFDQYRINKVSLSFIPAHEIVMQPSNQVTAVGYAPEAIAPAVGQAGLFGTVIDYDDAGAVAGGLNGFTQYSNWRYGQVATLKVHTRTFKPHVAVSAYAAGAFGAFANQAAQWIDCANPNVQHYGLKFYADKQAVSTGGAGVTIPQTWRIMAKYWVSFKNVR